MAAAGLDKPAAKIEDRIAIRIMTPLDRAVETADARVVASTQMRVCDEARGE